MSTFKYWRKISRLTQCALGGFASYIIALLSDGPAWFTMTKAAAGISMFFSIWGASVWHYGRCRKVYAKKHWDPVYIKNPRQVLCAGAVGFAISILISAVFLPAACIIIAILNAVTIMFLYAKFLDQYWPWKNISIALVCITPLLMGWFSGHHLNPIVIPVIIAAFFTYLTREVFKDTVDREANKGERFTMVMKLGIIATTKIGGGALIVAICMFLYSLKYAPQSAIVWILFLGGTGWLAWFAIKSLQGVNVAPKFVWMDGGIAMILTALLSVRFYTH
ncbi:MAG: UbiA family prenyltransferase [Parcubacteria group bacterium]